MKLAKGKRGSWNPTPFAPPTRKAITRHLRHGTFPGNTEQVDSLSPQISHCACACEDLRSSHRSTSLLSGCKRERRREGGGYEWPCGIFRCRSTLAGRDEPLWGGLGSYARLHTARHKRYTWPGTHAHHRKENTHAAGCAECATRGAAVKKAQESSGTLRIGQPRVQASSVGSLPFSELTFICSPRSCFLAGATACKTKTKTHTNEAYSTFGSVTAFEPHSKGGEKKKEKKVSTSNPALN